MTAYPNYKFANYQIAYQFHPSIQDEIRRYTKAGYYVRWCNYNSATFVKPKPFSFLWATLWFLCFGVGLLVYLFWYWAGRDTIVYVYIKNGKIVRQKG